MALKDWTVGLLRIHFQFELMDCVRYNEVYYIGVGVHTFYGFCCNFGRGLKNIVLLFNKPGNSL